MKNSEELSTKPELLYSISPRRFEELMAELVRALGYEVTLTGKTADGGYDIVAIKGKTVREKLLLECKRYSPDKRVGVGIVRSLHGVLHHESATKGIIVTTAQFSSVAQEYLKRHEWILEGRDFAGICEWLNTYQNENIARRLSLGE